MQYHSLEVLVAIYGYTLQLFLDFSGYSEMMVAFGLLIGFRLPVNFKAPLIAHNIRVFGIGGTLVYLHGFVIISIFP